MCGGRLSGGREGLAECFADRRLDFGARRDDEAHAAVEAEKLVERNVLVESYDSTRLAELLR